MDTTTDLQERLRDAGFSPRHATMLARAATGHAPDSDAGASPLTTTEVSQQVISALDDLRFPVGPVAARRRAELWETVFPTAIGDGGSDAQAEAPDEPERGTFPSIAGFCLGILALAGAPLLQVSIAVTLSAIVFSAISLGTPATKRHDGLRALAIAGLVLGTIAAVQVTSLFLFGLAFGIPSDVVAP